MTPDKNQGEATTESQSEDGEFERERVPDSNLLGPGKFWGMYAGEHCAGTEFMIGPLFLGAGATLGDLMVGLLLGNFLAVLTWRYLVVPIAMAKRYTLYYQLERIAGAKLVKLYNVVNGVLFCFLAGAMITVSASAVGVPFGIDYEVPESIFGLGRASFTVLVVLVGLVISVVAASGYATVARVANLAAPWMIIVFSAAGLVSLGQMEVRSLDDLIKGEYWSQAVEYVAAEYQQKGEVPPVFGFWQIVLFSWLCNGAMHLGMADLSIFRFARDKSSGWAPSIGMFLGHYMAWIAAGLLLAAQIKLSGDTTANPGVLAYTALGWTGILCVVIAGWTTANPTIYRAGLALQGVFTKSSRVQMTLLAGLVATIAGAFPNLSGRLLGFVGTYGTVLGPMGAIICVDYYIMRRRQADEPAARHRSDFNLSVLIAWLVPVLCGLYCIFFVFKQGTDAAYCVIPCWIACGLIYWGLRSALGGAPVTREPTL